MNEGRLTDVLIEEFKYRDPATGLEQFCNLVVWADNNSKKIIESVPGVAHVTSEFLSETKFYVYLDPRYDRE